MCCLANEYGKKDTFILSSQSVHHLCSWVCACMHALYQPATISIFFPVWCSFTDDRSIFCINLHMIFIFLK